MNEFSGIAFARVSDMAAHLHRIRTGDLSGASASARGATALQPASTWCRVRKEFAAHLQPRHGRAESVHGRDTAYAALFLASDEARFVTGTEIVVDGGMTARCD
jgi:NAD(P)-dependent dehydrogenase (short-subunit alcohol dehydrogenase family)